MQIFNSDVLKEKERETQQFERQRALSMQPQQTGFIGNGNIDNIKEFSKHIYTHSDNPTADKYRFALAEYVHETTGMDFNQAYRNYQYFLKEATGQDLDDKGFLDELGKTFTTAGKSQIASLKSLGYYASSYFNNYTDEQKKYEFSKLRNEIDNLNIDYRSDYTNNNNFFQKSLKTVAETLPSILTSAGIGVVGGLVGSPVLAVGLSSVYEGITEAGSAMYDASQIKTSDGQRLDDNTVFGIGTIIGLIAGLTNPIIDKITPDIANTVSSFLKLAKNTPDAMNIVSKTAREYFGKLTQDKVVEVGTETLQEMWEDFNSMVGQNIMIANEDNPEFKKFKYSALDIGKALTDTMKKTAISTAILGAVSGTAQTAGSKMFGNLKFVSDAEKYTTHTDTSQLVRSTDITARPSRIAPSKDLSKEPIKVIKIGDKYVPAGKAEYDRASAIMNKSSAMFVEISKDVPTGKNVPTYMINNYVAGNNNTRVIPNKGIATKDIKTTLNNLIFGKQLTDAQGKKKTINYNFGVVDALQLYKDGVAVETDINGDYDSARIQFTKNGIDYVVDVTQDMGGSLDVDENVEQINSIINNENLTGVNPFPEGTNPPIFKESEQQEKSFETTIEDTLKKDSLQSPQTQRKYSKEFRQKIETVLNDVNVHMSLYEKKAISNSSTVVASIFARLNNMTLQEFNDNNINDILILPNTLMEKIKTSPSYKKGNVIEGFTQKDNNKYTIYIGKESSPTTIIHELAHVFLSTIQDKSIMAGFDELYKKELELDGGKYGTNYQERFASELENFVTSGKMTNESQKSVFDFLLKAIKYIRDVFTSELSDKTNEEFNKLFNYVPTTKQETSKQETASTNTKDNVTKTSTAISDMNNQIASPVVNPVDNTQTKQTETVNPVETKKETTDSDIQQSVDDYMNSLSEEQEERNNNEGFLKQTEKKANDRKNQIEGYRRIIENGGWVSEDKLQNIDEDFAKRELQLRRFFKTDPMFVSTINDAYDHVLKYVKDWTMADIVKYVNESMDAIDETFDPKSFKSKTEYEQAIKRIHEISSLKSTEQADADFIESLSDDKTLKDICSKLATSPEIKSPSAIRQLYTAIDNQIEVNQGRIDRARAELRANATKYRQILDKMNGDYVEEYSLGNEISQDTNYIEDQPITNFIYDPNVSTDVKHVLRVSGSHKKINALIKKYDKVSGNLNDLKQKNDEAKAKLKGASKDITKLKNEYNDAHDKYVTRLNMYVLLREKYEYENQKRHLQHLLKSSDTKSAVYQTIAREVYKRLNSSEQNINMNDILEKWSGMKKFLTENNMIDDSGYLIKGIENINLETFKKLVSTFSDFIRTGNQEKLTMDAVSDNRVVGMYNDIVSTMVNPDLSEAEMKAIEDKFSTYVGEDKEQKIDEEIAKAKAEKSNTILSENNGQYGSPEYEKEMNKGYEKSSFHFFTGVPTTIIKHLGEGFKKIFVDRLADVQQNESREVLRRTNDYKKVLGDNFNVLKKDGNISTSKMRKYFSTDTTKLQSSSVEDSLQYFHDSDYSGELATYIENNLKNARHTKEDNYESTFGYTKQQLMNIYVMSHQIDAWGKLTSPKGNNLSPEEIMWVVKEFDTNAEYVPYKALADYIMKESGSRYDVIRDICYKLDNRVMDKISYYYPLVSDGQVINDYNVSMDGGKQDDKAHVKDSETKERTGGQYKLDLNLLSGYQNVIANQEHYISSAEYFADMNNLMNEKGLYAKIDQQFGRKTADYVSDYLQKNAQGTKIAYNEAEKWISWFRSNSVLSSLAYNLPTMAKQLATTNYLIARGISLPNFIKTVTTYFQDPKKFNDMVYQASPMMGMRNRMDVEASKKSNLDYKGKVANAWSNTVGSFTELGMDGIEKLDHMVANIMWQCVYDKNVADGMTDETAVRDATEWIMDTQPNTFAKNNPFILQERDGLIRTMLLFTNQSMKQFDMVVDDGIRFGVMKKQYKKFFSIIGATTLSMMACCIASGGMLPQDDDDKWWANMTNWFLGDLAGSIPIIGNSISNGIRGYGSDVDMFEPISRAFDLTRTMTNENAKTSDKLMKAEKLLSSTMGTLGGAPANAMNKLTNVIYHDWNLGYIINSAYGNYFER